jgi:sugar-specific transcriptional regulator TrmB
MAKDMEQLLISVGLLPSEVKVYLTTLKSGSETVQNIARAAGVSRTAAYDAIELLKNRGLMTSTLSGKKRLFSSEEPGRIVSYIKEEQASLAIKLEDVTKSLDVLRMMMGGQKPVVRTFEGKEAVFAYFDVLSRNKAKKFDEITNVDEVYQSIYEKTLLAARKAYKVKNQKGRTLHTGAVRNRISSVEYRELSKDWGDFHGNFAVFQNVVVIVTFSDSVTTVVIESEAFAKSMKTVFNAVWAISK